MKSKYTTYTLLAVVLVLWGIIAKRIFFSSATYPEVRQTVLFKENAEEPQQELSLNYRDPFISILAGKENTMDTGEKHTPFRHSVPLNSIFDVRYRGSVKGRSRNNLIIEVDGRYHSMRQGDSLRGFILLNVFPDSLQFDREGTLYHLTKDIR